MFLVFFFIFFIHHTLYICQSRTLEMHFIKSISIESVQWNAAISFRVIPHPSLFGYTPRNMGLISLGGFSHGRNGQSIWEWVGTRQPHECTTKIRDARLSSSANFLRLGCNIILSEWGCHCIPIPFKKCTSVWRRLMKKIAAMRLRCKKKNTIVQSGWTFNSYPVS